MMREQRTLVPLSRLLRKSEESVEIRPDQLYTQVTVRLWGQGVVERNTVLGSTIASDRRFVVRRQQLLVSRIDARNGAIGIVPDELDGAVVSNDFPCFDIVEAIPEYLGWYTRTSAFVRSCIRASEGTTNRVRLKEDRFLSIHVPLPPLEEQRRVVERLCWVMDRVQSARKIRRSLDEHTLRLLPTLANAAMLQLEREYGNSQIAAFDPVVTSGPRNWGERYSNASNFRFYRAQDLTANGSISDKAKVFVEPPGTQAQAARLVPGDVLIVITGATVGRCAVFTDRNEPGMVSQHVAVCRLPQDRIAPTFVRWALLSRSGQEQLLGQRYGQGKPGLNLTNIRNVRIPVPPMDIQLATVAKLDEAERQVEALRRLQAGSSVEIDALSGAVLNRAFNGAPE